MKILITSGGTKVPIDSVRDITNMSKGTFGSKIAKQFLIKQHQVHYFFNGDKAPFKFSYDYFLGGYDAMSELIATHVEWCKKHSERYQQSTYRNYDDYVDGLKELVETYKPDVIVLAAAVSDYVTQSKGGKVKSEKDMTIELQQAPKIISSIKTWCPSAKLVGFKLLVDASDEELEDAARQSIKKNGCDLVVANDLTSLKSGNHELLLVSKDQCTKHNRHQENLAQAVVKRIEEICHA